MVIFHKLYEENIIIKKGFIEDLKKEEENR
jgi:hypothetical protein